MAWITPSDITDVYANAELSIGQIAHLQGLAEGCIGPQTEPVSAAVQSAMVEIGFRFWRALQAANDNPAGYQSEQTPEYSYQNPAAGPMLSGFGLTDRECRALRKAAGVTGLGVQRISRGTVETPTAPDIWPEPDFDVV